MSIVTFPHTLTNIVIVNASPVTKELPTALLTSLKLVYPYAHKVTTASYYQLNEETILYIIICPAGYGISNPLLKPTYYIVYQLEPSTSHYLNNSYYLDFLRGALYIWDYSLKNVTLLTNQGISTTYIPPGHTALISHPELYHIKIPIKILMYHFWDGMNLRVDNLLKINF
jgi:hypothetical protein